MTQQDSTRSPDESDAARSGAPQPTDAGAPLPEQTSMDLEASPPPSRATGDAPVATSATDVEATPAPPEQTETTSAPPEQPADTAEPSTTEPTPAEATPAPADIAPVTNADAAPAPEQTDTEVAEPSTTEPAPEETDPTSSGPTPSGDTAPRPAAPSPVQLAGRRTAVHAPSPRTPAASGPSDSARFGRVGEDGTVYVRVAEEERAVGSYPGASPEEALAYFARKFDDLSAATELLHARVSQTDLSASEATSQLAKLRTQVDGADVVGDLPALDARLTEIHALVVVKQRADSQAKAAARTQATSEREALVVEAETLAATSPQKVQWKPASARMRSLLEEWKRHQRSAARLDKNVENEMWQRFSTARSAFDRTRKQWFAQLDEQHAEAARAKERLIAQAEALSTSTDWGPTAGAFRRLMDEWRSSGRAQRSVDDRLWQRFKAAQDTFFTARNADLDKENEGFAANLVVKEELLGEAEALLPVDATNLDSTKAALRSIQDRWDDVGKVPRKDMSRIENALRRVEQAVRDVQDEGWARTNPEVAARARSFAAQLEESVASLEADLERARSSDDAKAVGRLQSELRTRRQWLDQARTGVQENVR